MQPHIQLENIGKRYGRRVVLEGIDLEVRPGEVLGLVGPNGAGKTTLMEIMEGLRRPDTGTVTVLGTSAWPSPPAVRGRLGTVLQNTEFFPDLTVAETMRFFARLAQAPRAAQARALAACGLEGLGRRRVGQLSGGQRQRLAIATALVNTPTVLFLDEPSTGLDARARASLWDFLSEWRNRDRALVLTTHYLEEAEAMADRVAIIGEGRIRRVASVRALIDELEHDVVMEVSSAARAAPALTRVQGVLAANPTVRGDLVIQGRNLGQVVPAVTACLRDALGDVPRLTVRSVGLADALLPYLGPARPDTPIRAAAPLQTREGGSPS